MAKMTNDAHGFCEITYGNKTAPKCIKNRKIKNNLEQSINTETKIEQKNIAKTSIQENEDLSLAVGDGKTDDYQVIQEALNTKLGLKFSAGKIYRISQPLVLRSYHNIDLQGSTILVDGDYAAFTQSGVAVQKVHLYNGTIQGNTTASGIDENKQYNFPNQCGIKISCWNSTFENLQFSDLAYGIYFAKRSTGGATLVENRLLDVKFARCLNTAFYTEPQSKATDGFLENVKVGGDGYDYAINIDNAGGWMINSVHCYGNSKNKIRVGNCDNTMLSNIYLAGDYTDTGLLVHLYSNALLNNIAIRGEQNGSTMIRTSLSTSETYANKTLNVSNLTLSCKESGVIVNSITGYCDLYCSDIVFNDPNGCILAPTLSPVFKWNNTFERVTLGETIPSNGNLNDYVNAGNYAVKATAAAQNIQNMPVKYIGRMTVLEVGGSGNYLYRKQIYEPYSVEIGDRFIRTLRTSDGGKNWIFTDWKTTSVVSATT